jgi:cytochrome d ubiquinol oxidase subunit I
MMTNCYTNGSAFWIMVNNSWMQVPFGYFMENGLFVPNDWTRIIFNSVVWSPFPHMLLASYLTGAFCVAATGAWYLPRTVYHAESRIMLRMGLGLAAVPMPIQLLFGHLNGGYVNTYQPSKMAAIEGRWNDEKPGSEVLFAWPEAVAPRSSLMFMFWGCGLIVFPLMLIYTVISYSVFRAKIDATASYH